LGVAPDGEPRLDHQAAQAPAAADWRDLCTLVAGYYGRLCSETSRLGRSYSRRDPQAVDSRKTVLISPDSRHQLQKPLASRSARQHRGDRLIAEGGVT